MKKKIDLKKILNFFKKIDQKNSLHLNFNENKKMATLFGDKYSNFLLQLKGVSIKNKKHLIQILNSKPRSFLTNLIILVKKFKYFEYLLNKKMEEINPKTIISLSKKTLINKIVFLKKTNSISELKKLKKKKKILKKKKKKKK